MEEKKDPSIIIKIKSTETEQLHYEVTERFWSTEIKKTAAEKVA